VPANAYLDSSGDKWECERGYRDAGGACAAIEVPANGYLADSSYGSSWKCDRGYRAVDGACMAVEMPANAHLDYSGSGWDCNRPFRKQQDTCILP
jgi:hypothetical protein